MVQNSETLFKNAVDMCNFVEKVYLSFLKTYKRNNYFFIFTESRRY